MTPVSVLELDFLKCISNSVLVTVFKNKSVHANYSTIAVFLSQSFLSFPT